MKKIDFSKKSVEELYTCIVHLESVLDHYQEELKRRGGEEGAGVSYYKIYCTAYVKPENLAKFMMTGKGEDWVDYGGTETGESFSTQRELLTSVRIDEPVPTPRWNADDEMFEVDCFSIDANFYCLNEDAVGNTGEYDYWEIPESKSDYAFSGIILGGKK